MSRGDLSPPCKICSLSYGLSVPCLIILSSWESSGSLPFLHTAPLDWQPWVSTSQEKMVWKGRQNVCIPTKRYIPTLPYIPLNSTPVCFSPRGHASGENISAIPDFLAHCIWRLTDPFQDRRGKNSFAHFKYFLQNPRSCNRSKHSSKKWKWRQNWNLKHRYEP